ncbi:MAG: hypothetical protein ACK4UN_14715 [Limisphaerales bacterium]
MNLPSHHQSTINQPSVKVNHHTLSPLIYKAGVGDGRCFDGEYFNDNYFPAEREALDVLAWLERSGDEHGNPPLGKESFSTCPILVSKSQPVSPPCAM